MFSSILISVHEVNIITRGKQKKHHLFLNTQPRRFGKTIHDTYILRLGFVCSIVSLILKTDPIYSFYMSRPDPELSANQANNKQMNIINHSNIIHLFSS